MAGAGVGGRGAAQAQEKYETGGPLAGRGLEVLPLEVRDVGGKVQARIGVELLAPEGRLYLRVR